METNDELIKELSGKVHENTRISAELFDKFNVKRGLRNADHTGVLVGLTRIGDVVGYKKDEAGVISPIPGRLIYRGIDVVDLVTGCQKDQRHGFEETAYLLLAGNLPARKDLIQFSSYLASQRFLSQQFTKDVILSLKGHDMMNMLAHSVMSLYVFDPNAEKSSAENIILQSLNLIAKFPTIVAYSYHSMKHTYYNKTLSIRHPKEDLSIAENFLYMLKGGDRYTKLDAEILDLALILHAEHGGGNNSTFTVRVTSSTGTDTYSAITAAIGSLKGPLHGGANHMVMKMMDHLKTHIKNWKDEGEIRDYLLKMLKKQAFDNSGKIYGIGHAIYTISDPRALLLKVRARDLAIEKNRLDEFEFYEAIERLSIEMFAEFKGNSVNKLVCANVDFYSGFVYECIGLPKEIYTALFAMSRVAGWCAHRLEEMTFDARRIIRPAYKNVQPESNFISLDQRD